MTGQDAHCSSTEHLDLLQAHARSHSDAWDIVSSLSIPRRAKMPTGLRRSGGELRERDFFFSVLHSVDCVDCRALRNEKADCLGIDSVQSRFFTRTDNTHSPDPSRIGHHTRLHRRPLSSSGDGRGDTTNSAFHLSVIEQRRQPQPTVRSLISHASVAPTKPSLRCTSNCRP